METAESFGTKTAAREALSRLGLSDAQASAANRAVSRATSRKTIIVSSNSAGEITVRLVRSGRHGYQVMETIISPDGTKKVVQKAYNAAGQPVHYHPK